MTADAVFDLSGRAIQAQGRAGRTEVVAYDTMFTPAGDLNVARFPSGNPVLLGGINSTCEPDPLFGGASCVLFDPGTPGDPSDDFVLDVVFDDFHAEPADLPRGVDSLYSLAEVAFPIFVQNTEMFDINNTPNNPNDDVPDIRTNQFRSGFFGVVDDLGTPGDPSDDNYAFNGGYSANFTWAASALTQSQLTVDLRGADVQATGRGLVAYDWANEAVLGSTGTQGMYLQVIGGDADPSTTSGEPDARSLVSKAGPIDLGYWQWGSSAEADAFFDGQPGVSIADVFGTSPLIVNAGLGEFAPGAELAVQLPFRFTYDVDDVACPIDYGSPLDPDAPDGLLTGADFFSFLGRFVAGDLSADLAGPTDPTQPDGQLTGADFFRFLELFENGCVL